MEEVTPLGGETTIMRDARGLPVTVKRSDGSRIRMAYDAEGNLIESTDASSAARRVAIQVVGRLASRRRELVPALEKATRDTTPGVAREAVGALALVEGAEARSALRAVLSRGSEGETEALTLVLAHPTVDDVPALIAALRRRPASDPDRENVLHGLRVAAGMDVGVDPGAWEAWFRTKRK